MYDPNEFNDDDFDTTKVKASKKRNNEKKENEKKNPSPLVVQLNLAPKDASRLHELHIEAQTTFDDLSLPKSILLKAGLIALLSMKPEKRSDIIQQALFEGKRSNA